MPREAAAGPILLWLCGLFKGHHAIDRVQDERGCTRRTALGCKQFPVPLGDDLDGSVDHFDGGLIVDRVARHRHAGGPSFRIGHSVLRQGRVIEVRKDRKSTTPSVSSPPLGGFHPTKSCPMRGVITMLPALNPTQTVSDSDGKRSDRPDCCIQ